MLRQNSSQAGKPGVYVHRPQGTTQLSLDLVPRARKSSQLEGVGASPDRQKGLDISHGQFSESAPQYPVSRLHHRVWGQEAAALPTWPCPLRMGGWHEGSGEHGNVRLWRERTGRLLGGEEGSLKPASQYSDPTPSTGDLCPRPPPPRDFL